MTVEQVKALAAGFNAPIGFRDLLLKGYEDEFEMGEGVVFEEVDRIDDRLPSGETNTLAIFDVKTSNGVQRVGVYVDNAITVIDPLDVDDLFAHWAAAFDPEHCPDMLAAEA